VRRCAFTPLAEQDLEEIGDDIAKRNPRRAASFVRELRQRCQKIAQIPLAAPLGPELGQGVRVIVFRRYLICYAVRDDGQIVIERIVHGARRLVDLF
jgi:toxin ParE1/3/4